MIPDLAQALLHEAYFDVDVVVVDDVVVVVVVDVVAAIDIVAHFIIVVDVIETLITIDSRSCARGST